MKELAKTNTGQGIYAKLLVLLAACVLAAACLFCVPTNAYAAGSISVQYTGSDTEKPIAGIDVYAFKVATIEGDKLVLTDAYKRMAVLPVGWSAEGTAALNNDAAWYSNQLEVIETFATSGGDQYVATAATDDTGAVTLSGLDDGLYLLYTTGEKGSKNPHKFASSLVIVDGNGADMGNVFVEPKKPVEYTPPKSISVVKLWKGDKAADRPASIKVQLYCDGNAHEAPVELSDANGWTYTWKGLDGSKGHEWGVQELTATTGYSVLVNEDISAGRFTITNTKQTPPPDNPKDTEITISKQEVGGGPELPGATLIVCDENGNEIERWVSTNEPHKVTLKPGIYTLTEITAPDGYEIAETITFRVNEDGTTEVLVNGQWVDCANHVVMFDAKKGTPPATPTPPTATPTVTGKLPQTGQLWWPVPVMFCAGLIAVGAGRIVSHRSRAR